MLTLFKCLKFVKSFAATYSSYPLLIYAKTSFQIRLFSIFKNIQKNRFEDMELTAGGNYRMWNSLSKLKKEWNLQGGSTETPHSLRVLLFWPAERREGGGGGLRDVTHFSGSSPAMSFEFSRIYKTNLTSVENLKRHFLNNHACCFSGTDH